MPVFYRLTEQGQKLLTRSEVGLVRLHNMVLKLPVLAGPFVPVDWKRVRLQHWDRFVGSELGLRVEYTGSHVLVYADVLSGDNPYELLVHTVLECERLVQHLESKFRMKLGRPTLARNPHFAVADPVAERFTQNMNVSGPDGKMDRSEGYGEIDFTNPEAALQYLLMPSTVQALQRDLQGLKAGLTTIMQTWNIVGNRLIEVLELIRKERALPTFELEDVET